MKGAIWITWENQRRNRELAGALGVDLFEWKDIDGIRPRPLKYLVGCARTVRLLIRTRPRLVFCQNPSLVLASLLIRLRPVFGYRLVVDAHNAGLAPLEGRRWDLNRIAAGIQRGADLTLVSNEGLVPRVETNGGRAFVLPDRVPTPPIISRRPLKGRRNVLFVCSYALDEPYEEVLSAARQLDAETAIYITGNFRKGGIDPNGVAPNVVLTGYVTEEEYWSLLMSCDLVVDLTSRRDCLVCGAYEGVAAGVPMVLSDTPANRAYFRAGVVFTPHDAKAIASSISRGLDSGEGLRAALCSLRQNLTADWQARKEQLLATMAHWQR